jgi:hypothetical protein
VSSLRATPLAAEFLLGYVSKQPISTHSNTRSLKHIDPETASQPIADALALLPWLVG